MMICFDNTDKTSRDIVIYDKEMHQITPKSHYVPESHPIYVLLVSQSQNLLLQGQLFSC